MKLRFGDCTFDGAGRRLSCRGRDVHLPAKAFEILAMLVDHRPRALSKAELLERAWPGVFVSDDSLAKVVSQIRKAVRDDESAPIIRTVHGYGYAFEAAAVEIETDGPESQQRRARCWMFCGAREFPLIDGEHLVGREPDNSIYLNSPRVSRRHARVVVNGMEATIEDLGSKNGSFVGGARITGPTRLASGDEASIGPFKLLFRVSAESGSTETERW